MRISDWSSDVCSSDLGMSFKDMGKVNFMASYNDAVSLMKDGHAAAFTLGTTIPAAAVMDLASARDMKLLPVTDSGLAAMKKINAGYNKRSEEHTSELQSLMRISYAVFCLKKKTYHIQITYN